MTEQTDRLITAITEPPPVPPRTLRMGHPAPGVEYPFSISDIAYATARLLGPDWSADAGHWGITGYLFGPYAASFTFLIDVEGDLCMTYALTAADGWPESPQLPAGFQEFSAGVFLPGACVADGVDHLAAQHAAAVRAITGR
ncbi:hypothetical protein ACGFZA_41940 [Streptomyces sp. NPDC048211]|uniref:hypothetical protein n=1 Tax=Streptomyces sp. NPDC048211 TaxID=3365516 RepID=UPI0037211302